MRLKEEEEVGFEGNEIERKKEFFEINNVLTRKTLYFPNDGWAH